jgi:NAD(P)-dependent dehydrogenase (short-subunit alcohol dehydrogenase family)
VETTNGTVLLTGPTGGLGRAATLTIANRPEPERPDLLLVGRSGRADRGGRRRQGSGCDGVRDRLRPCPDSPTCAPRARRSGIYSTPARCARVMSVDPHIASTDGYGLAFAVNYLAHAQLIGDLPGSFAAWARIVLLGSDPYHQNVFRRILRVPPASWRDPIDLARPAPPDAPATFNQAGIAYSNAKLAILYYAHELQRRAPSGVTVAVFEPGFMPGTGLARGVGPGMPRATLIADSAEGAAAVCRARARSERWWVFVDGALVAFSFGVESLGGLLGSAALAGGHGQAAVG